MAAAGEGRLRLLDGIPIILPRIVASFRRSSNREVANSSGAFQSDALLQSHPRATLKDCDATITGRARTLMARCFLLELYRFFCEGRYDTTILAGYRE